MKTVLFGGSLLFTLSMVSCDSSKQKQPNIIFILADDMGYGDVSYLDSRSKIKTENLDRMAREGVVFNHAHSSS